MKSNIQYYGALQKYTLSSDYPSTEIYLHIEDVEAIPIEWLLNQLLEEGLIESHHIICCLWERWKEENGNV